MQSVSQREFLLGKDRSERGRLLAELSEPERRQLQAYWPFWARENQLPPPGDWRTWLIMAGRGFGKTRAGAEWVRHVASSEPSARIALVASSIHEARAVLVEGESGILACHRGKVRPRFESSTRRLLWPNGAQAMLFSAGEPESLRGPQHTHACRPGAEGVYRQRGIRPARRPATRGSRGRGERSSGKSGRW